MYRNLYVFIFHGACCRISHLVGAHCQNQRLERSFSKPCFLLSLCPPHPPPTSEKTGFQRSKSLLSVETPYWQSQTWHLIWSLGLPSQWGLAPIPHCHFLVPDSAQCPLCGGTLLPFCSQQVAISLTIRSGFPGREPHWHSVFGHIAKRSNILRGARSGCVDPVEPRTWWILGSAAEDQLEYLQCQQWSPLYIVESWGWGSSLYGSFGSTKWCWMTPWIFFMAEQWSNWQGCWDLDDWRMRMGEKEFSL